MKDGLYRKYNVERVDGKDVTGQDFFVLRLDAEGRHGAACRMAALYYADHIEKELPELAEDLRRRVYVHIPEFRGRIPWER